MKEPLENPAFNKIPKSPNPSESSILGWRDRYVTRIDREMCAAFPQLASNLEDHARNKFWKIVFSKGYSFVNDVIQPELDLWVSRYVSPILSEAGSELSEIPSEPRHKFRDNFVLRTREVTVSPAFLLVGGIGSVVLGFSMGISTTGWWIFKKQEVNWPTLLTFLIVGVALIIFGTAIVTLSKSKISKAFRGTCLPKLRESVLGEGSCDPNGNLMPSLRQKLQMSVQAVAEEHITNLKNS